jgi:tRNA (adenine22-N1)-methyltransferase
MMLSDRLKTIADFVPLNSIVGDIGTDHGYLPVYLIEKGISKKVIASDISKNSLEKIIQLVKLKGLEDKIDIRLGDGLEVFKPFEVDTLVIAGMGGLLIRDILDENKKIADSIVNFILQPNMASKELREYLYENSFEIVDEKLVKEAGKFYEIIFAKRGKDYVEDDIYLEFGKRLFLNKDPLLKEYIQHKIAMVESIIGELIATDSQKSRERYFELKEKIRSYKEVLSKIESF